MKRLFDIIISLLILTIFSPILLIFILWVYLTDFHNPFYVASRIGKNKRPFKMIKLRSMTVNADKTGVVSTSKDDKRITKVGSIIRKFKIDEIMQCVNVLIGDMSMVGPRPNVQQDVAEYTAEEERLLSVRPGITDMASIVFSDEGDILEGREDPNLTYNQLIRPWKSRLGLLYVDNKCLSLDIFLIFNTAIAILSREKALSKMQHCVAKYTDNQDLIKVAGRQEALAPKAPPGSDEIFQGYTS